LPPRESFEIDPLRPSVERQHEAVVYQSLPHHPAADTGLVQQLHGRPFQQSRAYAPLDMVARVALEDDTCHPLTTQKL